MPSNISQTPKWSDDSPTVGGGPNGSESFASCASRGSIRVWTENSTPGSANTARSAPSALDANITYLRVALAAGDSWLFGAAYGFSDTQPNPKSSPPARAAR